MVWREESIKAHEQKTKTFTFDKRGMEEICNELKKYNHA